MKILVCISITPETTAKIAFTDNNTQFDKNGVNYILNPYDEWYGLVRAMEVKEAAGGTVTVINVGTTANDASIRKALAIGADNAVRVDADPKSANFVAAQVAAYAKAENFDMVFFGKETIDYSSASVGAMVAEHLDMPFISFATGMELNGNTATIQREIEGGKEVLEVATPFALSAAKGLAEQRIPNMRGIMQARRKPLKVVPAIETADLSTVVSYDLPPAKSAVKIIDADNMDELVRLLHEEAKIL